MRNRLDVEKLRPYRGYALILAFIVSAMAQRREAPDAISLAVVALSIYLLFEVGLGRPQALHKLPAGACQR